MNTNNLIYQRITLFFMLIGLFGLFQCDVKKLEANEPEDESALKQEEELVLRYQLFNLELAAEEAAHIQRLGDGGKAKNSGTPSCMVALKELKDPCNFKCELFDYECIQQYIDCKEASQITYNYSADDGDGAEPLPTPSDTSLMANIDRTEMVIFSDDPESSNFKLMTNEGAVYAVNNNSPEYDKEKRQAVYKIQVKNPEHAGKPLLIHMNTMIVNAVGEKRQIELKHPFGLVFTKERK